MSVSTAPFTATVLGSARIGPNRELKKAIEAYWSGRLERPGLAAVAAQLRADTWSRQRSAGLDSIPVGTFSLYDHVLDTAFMLGAVPERVAGIPNHLDRYFAAARGTASVAPLEMTKWFDTNYHYLVPEIGPDTVFRLDATRLLAEVAQAHTLGVPARPVVLGPITFLKSSKPVDGQGPLLDRVDELVPLYVSLLGRLRDAGASWVQIDEPALVTDLDDTDLDAVTVVYQRLGEVRHRPAILVASYFGQLGPALPRLARTAIDGIAVDLASGSADSLTDVPELADKLVVAGIVDGRNIWRNDLEQSLTTLIGLRNTAATVAVSTSCSLLHVPYTVVAETRLDKSLRCWLAFGAEKEREVVTLATALSDGRDAVADALASSRTAAAVRRGDPRLRNAQVRADLGAVGHHRGRSTPAAERRGVQQARLGLPVLPTTTIGSYPQTSRIRIARADLRAGRIEQAEYVHRMRAEIDDVIALQEELGLDVLVHGEPERNDMVQYFAEQLDGFFATDNGWVQSYGTRCVRPPILYGDVTRNSPMTVDWITYAQSQSANPVKGMLTGPVTILAWSFVRDDQPLADTADQVALAIRQETIDLENAGVDIIQVDEPALRELLPLRAADKDAYLEWSIGAFRLATSGVRDDTQIHTHLCYSEFGEVIDAIARLDADVTSIEAARSHMEILTDLDAAGFDLGVGPGVYDIHSPRVPSVEEIASLLRKALIAVPAERLWINPDCGLKTRGPGEVKESLANMVAAAKAVRAEIL
ncbi:5-methyltetrahydropteroyltriglutamate--homocysteine S-methyltransferase [Rhodococcus zopfii]|uniref:5-methyltetrahydropteroyltriglutamate--homocysteine methyltransferase n=1 Tax=Rhodococcus zopfii TaxID=43772 RepID=A0ABU3WRS9_9NOCA|nr:5-methyltetrahydropteroyltriglutamate--homocysteine S-methyltransferase [Rhodococcus zopfii]